jgi:chromosome segregation ATPase
MTDSALIDSATQRLSQALEQLEAAVDRWLEVERSYGILAEQVHTLDADRARLAADLDTQLARSRRLESTNRDVAKRVDAAMENIKLVLDAQGE